MRDALRAMYDHGHAVTIRLLETAGPLTPAQWRDPVVSGSPSVRDTLVHTVSTQRGWLSSWIGEKTAAEAIAWHLDPDEFASPAALVPVANEVRAATIRFLESLAPGELERVDVADLPGGMRIENRLWWMVLHVANHGTQHRSEAALLLTSLVRSVGPVDLMWHFSPRPGAA